MPNSRFGCISRFALLLFAAFSITAGAQTAHFSYAQQTLGSGFASPSGVALDASGNVYVADTGNGAVKQVSATGAPVPVTSLGGGISDAASVAVDASGKRVRRQYLCRRGHGDSGGMLVGGLCRYAVQQL